METPLFTLKRAALFLGAVALWIVAYFGIVRATSAWPRAVLDWDPVRFVPVIGAFVIPYFSVYAVPLVAFAVLRRPRAYAAALGCYAGIILICSVVFLAMPLAIARPAIAGGGAGDGLLRWLWAVDAPTNLCPSLHVAAAFFFAALVGRERPGLRVPMFGWALLIAASTLFTRQHYLVDVLAGALVAAVAWRAFLRLDPKQTPVP